MQRPIRAVVMLLILAGGASDASADWFLGIQGGANLTSLNGDTPPKTKYHPRTGLVLGAVLDWRLKRDIFLSFQPTYQQRGATSEVAVPGQEDPVPGDTLEMDYLVLPVLARIVSDNRRTFAVGGVSVGYLLDGDLVTPERRRTSAEDIVREFDLAAVIGFGALIPVRKTVLSLEVRYEQSILNLAERSAEGDETDFPVRFRVSGFQFLAGLQWSLGGRK